MRRFVVMLGLVLVCVGARAQNGSDAQLQKVLAQLDAAAAKFQTAQAEFTWDQLTAVVDEHDIQKGMIAFKRGAGGTAMVAHVATDNGQAAPKDVLFQGGELDFYQPAIKQETILKVGTNRQQFESFATLGFGGSGRDLQANWNVTYKGADTVDGAQVVKLALTPKNAGLNPMFTQIEIWIDPATATSRKQVFHNPAGDTRTATYTAIKVNQKPQLAFELKIPKGTNVVTR